MKSNLRLHLKSTPELEQMLRTPLVEIDREAVERELQQRGERPMRGMFEKPPEDPGQGRLFE